MTRSSARKGHIRMSSLWESALTGTIFLQTLNAASIPIDESTSIAKIRDDRCVPAIARHLVDTPEKYSRLRALPTDKIRD